MPLPAVATLEALEIEMNDALAAIGWGAVQLEVDEADPALTMVHTGLPRIGSAGTPPGQWLARLLPGLYGGLLAQQPGSQAALHTYRVAAPAGPAVRCAIASQRPGRHTSLADQGECRDDQDVWLLAVVRRLPGAHGAQPEATPL